MNHAELSCPKCSERMEEGFIQDQNMTSVFPSVWVQGRRSGHFGRAPKWTRRQGALSLLTDASAADIWNLSPRSIGNTKRDSGLERNIPKREAGWIDWSASPSLDFDFD